MAGAKGEGLRFRLTRGAKVELTDDDARNGPQGIKVRRIGDDLHIALPGSDVAKPDVIIQDFYKNNEGNQLIGRGADGQYHPYAVDKISTNLPCHTGNDRPQSISPWGKVTEAVAPVIATDTVPTAATVHRASAATERRQDRHPGLGAGRRGCAWALRPLRAVGVAASNDNAGCKPITSVEPTEATGNANEGAPATFTVTLRNPGNTATTWHIQPWAATRPAPKISTSANLSLQQRRHLQLGRRHHHRAGKRRQLHDHRADGATTSLDRGQ